MTAVPQRTAFSHAFGALAAALIGTAEYYAARPRISAGFAMGALVMEVLLGFLTFTGQHDGRSASCRRSCPRVRSLIRARISSISRSWRGGCAGIASGHYIRNRRCLFPILLIAVAAVWRAADHADRRRGYADGDRSAELLRRLRQRAWDLCLNNKAADRGRRAGWLFRIHSRRSSCARR